MKNKENLWKLLFTLHQNSFQPTFWQTLQVAGVIFVKDSIPRKHIMLATGGAWYWVCINNFVISQQFWDKNSKIFEKIEKNQYFKKWYFFKQKFLRHQVSWKNPNLSAYVLILHTHGGDGRQSFPGGNWRFFGIFEISRFLTILRKSPKCAMKVAYTPNEAPCLAWSGSRTRYPSYFVDFAQILIKNRKNSILEHISKNLVDASASTNIEMIFTSTDLWNHFEYISFSRWSRRTPLGSPRDAFVSIYPHFRFKKSRC